KQDQIFLPLALAWDSLRAPNNKLLHHDIVPILTANGKRTATAVSLPPKWTWHRGSLEALLDNGGDNLIRHQKYGYTVMNLEQR
ncbi:hypothetical protein KI387_036121, partial [Taxus chinensis]